MRVLLVLIILSATFTLAGCGGNVTPDGSDGGYPYTGSFSGTYTGSEEGEWSAIVDDAGTIAVTIDSPSMGMLMGSNTISDNGQVTVQTSGLVGGPTITWHGSFVKTGNLVFTAGDWQSTNGLQGSFIAGNQSIDLQVTAQEILNDLIISQPQVGTEIKWSKSALEGLNVQEFHIWRSGVAGPVMTALPTATSAYDNFQQKYISYSATNAQMRGTTLLSSNVPAIDYGKHYTYSVSALCSVRIDGILRFFETPLSSSGQVTALTIMPISNLKKPSASSHQILNSVAFEWLSIEGADTYVIEISTDPTFDDPEFVSNTITPESTDTGETIALNNVSLIGAFGSLFSSQRLYWRIGAKCSTDSSAHYIYSPSAIFYPQGD